MMQCLRRRLASKCAARMGNTTWAPMEHGFRWNYHVGAEDDSLTLAVQESAVPESFARRFFIEESSVRHQTQILVVLDGVDEAISVRRLLYQCVLAAERGGQEIRAVRRSGDLGTRSKSLCFNPVTLGDIRSHVAMTGTLKHAFPRLNVVSEEDELRLADNLVDFAKVEEEVPVEFIQAIAKDGRVMSSDVTVWIDPLDGTREFTDGADECVTTMVGIAVKGEAVAGVIHMPFAAAAAAAAREKTYWAWKGYGVSSALSQRGAATNGRAGDMLRIAVSKNPFNAGTVHHFAQLAFPGRPLQLIPLGGAGHKMIQVLLGNVDAYLHVTRNIKKWDICAGHGLINALNGRLTGLSGQGIRYDPPEDLKKDVVMRTGFVCSLDNHEQLLEGCTFADKNS